MVPWLKTISELLHELQYPEIACFFMNYIRFHSSIDEISRIIRSKQNSIKKRGASNPGIHEDLARSEFRWESTRGEKLVCDVEAKSQCQLYSGKKCMVFIVLLARIFHSVCCWKKVIIIFENRLMVL